MVQCGQAVHKLDKGWYSLKPVGVSIFIHLPMAAATPTLFMEIILDVFADGILLLSTKTHK